MKDVNDLNSKLASSIRGRRNALNLTLEEVGKKAGVSRNTVWAVEQNKYNVQLVLVLKILESLGLKALVYTDDGEFNQTIL